MDIRVFRFTTSKRDRRQRNDGRRNSRILRQVQGHLAIDIGVTYTERDIKAYRDCRVIASCGLAVRNTKGHRLGLFWSYV